MTQREVVEHWRKGAWDALEMARAALERSKYDHVLFNCHLAVEKALKARYIDRHDEEHPHTHELLRIALLIQDQWDDGAKEFLSHLSDYAIAARYSDPAWAERQATRENAVRCLERTEQFLQQFLSSPS